MPLHKILVISILILSLSLAGCQSSAAPPDDVPEPELPQNQVNPTESPEQAEEPQDEMSFLSCPTSGESLVLGFDHAVTIEQPDVNLTHILKEGYLTLVAGEADADGTVSLSSVGNPSLDYEMMGVMGPCSVTMAGIMQVSASGTCNDGVVYLTIIETWQSADGNMVCDGTAMAFSSPGPGAFTHEGADGAGEVFYLVDSSEGYTVMRPFGAGSGYHSWTLYATQIPLVPLVP
ncbi:MAG TPA: hypothetical protein PKY64_02555 [Anaerolineaceae bacterium]|nr:hypothetical protein [Anaerolineaceae bacterium]